MARVIEQAERDVRRRRALARLAVERGQRQREVARGQRLGHEDEWSSGLVGAYSQKDKDKMPDQASAESSQSFALSARESS